MADRAAPNAQFEHRHGTDVEAARWFVVEPGQDLGIGGALDDLADDVGVEQEHDRSLKVDLAVRRWKAAKCANFLQGGEKGIVSLDGISRVFEWLRRGLRSLEHGPQTILDERAQGLPVTAGLLLRQVQKSLINVQNRLHHVKLRREGVVVNAGYLREGHGVQNL